jgi:tetratricopeptide (TPR) repeat protein
MGNQPGDTVRVDVRIQDADTGETVSPFAEEGTIATLSDLLRKVAADLRSRVGVPNPSPGVQINAKTALPSDPEALRLYTEGLAKLRLFDALGARDQLEKSISLEPNFALPHFALARTWQILGYDAKARDEAKKAVELSGDLPPQEKRSIEAQYRELNGEWDKAAAIYDALWVLYPDEPNYALSLSNTQISDGKAQVALETLQKLSKQPGMEDDPRVDLSVALAAESLSDIPKQRDAAASSAEKAKRQGSRLLAAHAYWQLCSAYYALGEYEKGEQACNDSTRSAPFDDEIKARSQTVWASIMEAQGNTSQALEMRRQALETAQKIGSQKDVVGALQNLADLLDAQGGGEDAQKYYEEALEIAHAIGDKSGAVKVTDSLAAHRNSLGDFVGAEALYLQSLEEAREINDSGMTATVLLNLGMLQDQLGKLDEAQKNTQQAIALYREAGIEIYMPSAMNVLGDLYTDRGELPAARKSYEESLKLSIKQKSAASVAAGRAAIAALDLEEEKPAEAELLARQAADEFASEKLVDNEADARSSLARSLLTQGKLSEARAETDRALKLKPRDRNIALALSITDARVKSKEGKTVEASKILETSLAEASKSKLVGSALQIKFCQAEMEIQVNPKSAASLFAALQKDAVAKGYLLIGSQAQVRVKQLSKT